MFVVNVKRSKYYLPTLRAALNCPIFGLFSAPDFTYSKPLLLPNETTILQALEFLFPFCVTCEILSND